MSDLEGDDLAFLNRFKDRASVSKDGRRAREAKVPFRRQPGSGRKEQLNLKVRPEWKQHVADIAREDRRSMIEVLELGLELYERNRERFR